MISFKAWRVGVAFLSFCAIALWAQGSQAGLLGLNPHAPDLTSGFINIDYDHVTGQFTATGYALSLDSAHPVSGGTFEIDMTLSPAGVPSGGSLLITGDIPDLSLTGPLVTGSLSQFGFGTVSQPLEFIFDVTGGSMKSGYFPSQVGVVLSDSEFQALSSFSFSHDIHADAYAGDSDTYAIPEPCSFAIWIAGSVLCGLPCLARRRRRPRH